MADPVTAMMVVGMGASAGGAITGAIGSEYQGAAQSNMYGYQAGVAQINKQIAMQNADYERRVGEVKAQESGMKTGAVIAQTKTIQGASNLDVNRGSAADVRESEHAIGRQDQDIIRSNAARLAYGKEVEATQFESQSELYKMAQKTSKTAGHLGAISSILGGVSSVASKWTQAKSAGAFG